MTHQDHPHYVPVRDAAVALGVSESTVLRRCRTGELNALVDRGRWLVARSALPQSDAQPPPPDEHPTVTITRRLSAMPALLTIEQVGALTGLSTHSVRSGVRRHEIPSIRIGGVVRVPAVELARLVGVPEPKAVPA